MNNDMTKEPSLSAGVIRTLVDAHHGIAQIKYLYLLVVQNEREIRPADKLRYQEEVVGLAEHLHGYFGNFPFRVFTPANLGEVERSIMALVKDLSGRVDRMRKRGQKLVPGRTTLVPIPMADEQVDAALREARIRGQPALEKHHHDRIDSIKQFLLSRALVERPTRAETAGEKAESRIFEMRMEALAEGWRHWTVDNPTFLAEAVTLVTMAVEDGARVSVVEAGRDPETCLNDNQLYVADIGGREGQAFSLFLRDHDLQVWLELQLTEVRKDGSTAYVGQVHGWVLEGDDRISVGLRDSNQAAGKPISPPECAALAETFLRKSGLASVYARIRAALEARVGTKGEDGGTATQEAKDRVSRALRAALQRRRNKRRDEPPAPTGAPVGR